MDTWITPIQFVVMNVEFIGMTFPLYAWRSRSRRNKIFDFGVRLTIKNQHNVTKKRQQKWPTGQSILTESLFDLINIYLPNPHLFNAHFTKRNNEKTRESNEPTTNLTEPTNCCDAVTRHGVLGSPDLLRMGGSFSWWGPVGDGLVT